MKRDKKDEESGAVNPFLALDKTTVLQEARVFNETPINARRCGHILTKLLYMLGQGEVLGRTEATEAFFAVTKLWQSKDQTLRRLVYLAIKELSSMADDVIIVTSSLTKDMTGREDQYRAAAIRALCCITDSTMLQAIERYMKQAIVDKVPAVASAALVSSLHMMRKSPDVVRRWANEVQEAVNSEHSMVQYHALCVLYHVRKNDRLAVNKLVQKCSKQTLKSPYALCFLIRLASKLIEEGDSNDTVLFDFLESCLRHKCEVVIYEAASAITRLPTVSNKELAPAISVLQLFCSSPKPSQRFAAVRTLSKISIDHPAAVATCNMDLEQLINDSNRSIATLAITTLLKTGAESSVERLMKQISHFVSDIPDEFKIVVIQAIRSLCVRYPRKHAVMMSFLAQMLRDDGGYSYKKSIVDTIMMIIEENQEAKETGLSHLCEFIEDCEHANLATRVLHLLGREAPKTPNPQKYIRFVYNRVILEAPQVRAAAVTALAKFGAQVAELQPSICVLLERCLTDEDDEVRDRATYYLAVLKQQNQQVNNNYVINGLQVSMVGLERALQSYCTGGTHDKPFDLRIVPVSSQPITQLEEKEKPPVAEAPMKQKEDKRHGRMEIYAEQLAAVPEFAEFGPLFHSSEPIALTESETEYVVVAFKHTFHNHIVFQFDVRNTLPDVLLDKAWVQLTPESEAWQLVATTHSAGPVKVNETQSLYAAVAIPEDVDHLSSTFGTTLKYILKDCDPNTQEPDSDEGYQDEYQMEDMEVNCADHMQRVVKPNFHASWSEGGDDVHDSDETYALSTVNTIQEACTNLVGMLGLGVCERSDRVPDGKYNHTLLLSGVYRGGHQVLVRAKFAVGSDGAITMNLAVRSTSEEAITIINEAFG